MSAAARRMYSQGQGGFAEEWPLHGTGALQLSVPPLYLDSYPFPSTCDAEEPEAAEAASFWQISAGKAADALAATWQPPSTHTYKLRRAAG